MCVCRLSGESPFQGGSDAETLALVTSAQWEFDEESFEEISGDAQGFISALLNKAPRWVTVSLKQSDPLPAHRNSVSRFVERGHRHEKGSEV